MKLYRMCSEEFSDKFVFCPVDGSALNKAAPVPSDVAEPSAIADERTTAAMNAAPDVAHEARGNGAPPPLDNNGSAQTPPAGVPPVDSAETVGSHALFTRGKYHLTMLHDGGVERRLWKELREVAHKYEMTWPEFKRDSGGEEKAKVEAEEIKFFPRQTLKLILKTTFLYFFTWCHHGTEVMISKLPLSPLKVGAMVVAYSLLIVAIAHVLIFVIEQGIKVIKRLFELLPQIRKLS